MKIKNPFKLDIDPDELNEYYRDRLFELVDYDAIQPDRKKIVGENRYEYIDNLVCDIVKNNKIYQSNGKTIGFMYGAFYTIMIIFIIRVGVLMMQ
ncbi:MAG: hypothetical protein IJ880_11105 [Bacilli bacterium]|nr:hypothetical protein [Bacilli bacterium]